MIIEAARPCVTSGQIKTIGEYTARSISYIMPSVSTIIYDGMVLDRHKTYVLQVPQAFDTSLLISAHECTKNENPTDDTSLMQEVHGISPKLLLGGRNLTKMTVREDMKILEEYL